MTGAIAVVNDGTVMRQASGGERAEATVTRLRPISPWLLILAVMVSVAVAGPATVWLYGIAGDDPARKIEAIKTGLTVATLMGGVSALLLAFRRQRSTELTLVHTDRDATERRITELYTKAAEMLGSNQAPVRLAGLYALERLAHSTVEHRQTIVDVICAYLRMPYALPDDRPPGQDAPAEAHTRYEQRRQERQVRLTAQNILSRNLRVAAQRRRWWHRTPPNIPAWSGIGLDLTGALLLDFFLTNCQLDYADFTHAQFIGEADFGVAEFTHWVTFGGAQFTGKASFRVAQLTFRADFERAQFIGEADFEHAEFSRVSRPHRPTLAADFPRFQFGKGVDFRDAQFTSRAKFAGAQFIGKANFAGAQFTGGAEFNKNYVLPAVFTGKVNFKGARVASTAKPGSVWPPGWTTRPPEPDNGEDPTFLYLTKAEDANPPDT